MLRAELRRLADRVAARLREAGLSATTIAIKVRKADFTTLSRSQTLAEPTQVGQRIGEVAVELFGRLDLDQPIRLVGVRGENLRASDGSVLALWDDDAEWRRIDEALDDAHARFGRGAVTRASALGVRRGLGALPGSPRLPFQ